MLHVGRCGSTVVGRMLDAHPEITWDGELFEPSHRTALGIPADAPPGELIAARRQAAAGHYGFETKYLQSHHLGALALSLAEYLELLDGLEFTRYVALHRRNYLRRVVSGAVGRVSGVWHRKASDEARRVAVRLDPEAVPFGDDRPLLDVFAELEAGEAELRRLLAGREALWLTYEDDIERDPAAAYGKVCAHLGVAPAPSTPAFSRSNPFSLPDMLENHDEIAAVLEGTRYEWMLESPGHRG